MSWQFLWAEPPRREKGHYEPTAGVASFIERAKASNASREVVAPFVLSEREAAGRAKFEAYIRPLFTGNVDKLRAATTPYGEQRMQEQEARDDLEAAGYSPSFRYPWQDD